MAGDLDSAFEDGAEGGVVADFVGDAMEPGRGAEGVFDATGWVGTCGDGEGADKLAVFEDPQGLALDGDEEESRCLLDIELCELMDDRLQ